MDLPASLPVEVVPISRLFCSPTNPRCNDEAVSRVVALPSGNRTRRSVATASRSSVRGAS